MDKLNRRAKHKRRKIGRTKESLQLNIFVEIIGAYKSQNIYVLSFNMKINLVAPIAAWALFHIENKIGFHSSVSRSISLLPCDSCAYSAEPVVIIFSDTKPPRDDSFMRKKKWKSSCLTESFNFKCYIERRWWVRLLFKTAAVLLSCIPRSALLFTINDFRSIECRWEFILK